MSLSYFFATVAAEGVDSLESSKLVAEPSEIYSINIKKLACKLMLNGCMIEVDNSCHVKFR